MSVPFPFTRNGVGSGFGRIEATDDPLYDARAYTAVPQASGHAWFIDNRLQQDASTALTIVSALQASRAGQTVYVSLTDVKPDIRLGGASCGLAAAVAIMTGVTTDVLITGYIQSFGDGVSTDILVLDVDDVDAKIEYCLRSGHAIIVPSTSDSRLLEHMIHERTVTTVENLWELTGRNVFVVGAAHTFAGLGIVLHAMDPSVDLNAFAPPARP